ncbi:acetyltransferase [[Clostridium] sordellii]|uniref:N-acetyltransferase n=2 Tax=Paraclostridium sordellii TaxID=1505 RepID=UPI0005DFBC05|nr:N-acetyltransferase [Paeniclostridium sordellii]CEO35688.1 acetyltransferase [[Clostridium] sordellii] [Paeniclostridium sordellii]CEP92658.1 acetyltransferase [[Clostridium] sordellii] [Paeniclostridium sordellii]CEQ06587.1 acetyltransferase [[Clostridium] sordellii] [Paeniclostridium sordellii]
MIFIKTLYKIINVGNIEGKLVNMIRKLENKDIDKIMDIWLKSTIKAHDFIEEKYWKDNYNTVKNIYIPMADSFVYEDDKGINGFISIINNEFIGALFVDIDNQGSGIGKKLIDHVMHKYNHLSLAVYKENKKSVDFYISRGFKIIKEQLNEDSGYEEYIMEKTI